MNSRHPAAIVLVLATLLAAPGRAHGWGFAVHRVINRNAVANIPSDFQEFARWATELEAMSTAADERKCCVNGEDIRHYIDIDDYPEFFAGTFPRNYEAALAQYGRARLESNGVGPWALEESYERLVAAFTVGDWTKAVAEAADIGHYAGDLHQPLHLTTNFDGQETGQNGIHSRFETRLTGRHLTEFTPLPGPAPHLADPLARTFEWIDEIYAGLDDILAADLAAKAAAGGSTSSDAYYNTLWERLGQDTWYWIASASRDVASLWYTAWKEAGAPALPGSIPVEPASWSRIKAQYRR